MRADVVPRYRNLLQITEVQREELRRWAKVPSTLRTTRKTIAIWKSRFEENGIEGLEPRHKAGRAEMPPDGGTHWSRPRLAVDLDMSHATVQRILEQAKLQPHRLVRYMASNDPDFAAKAANIIGLYLNPPQHAAIFFVDEKTAIQALDCFSPLLPMMPGTAERMAFNTTCMPGRAVGPTPIHNAGSRYRND